MMQIEDIKEYSVSDLKDNEIVGKKPNPTLAAKSFFMLVQGLLQSMSFIWWIMAVLSSLN